MRTAGETVDGKIQKALWLISEFPEAIEADLQRYYGLDFVRFFGPGSGLSWRKLMALIDYLPPESALNTAVRNITPEERLAANAGDPVKARWSSTESFLAALIDEVRNLGWMYASAHTDRTIAKPSPIRRPGVGSGRSLRRPMSLDAIRAIDPRMRNVPDDQVQDALNALTGRRDGS